MTMQEIIERVDAMRPNGIPEGVKVGWLTTLDGLLRQRVVEQHMPEGRPLLGVGADVDPSITAELLVQPPHHAIYEYWLCAQIDFALGEITRYSNSMALYNATLESFAVAYKVGHRPVSRGQFVI